MTAGAVGPARMAGAEEPRNPFTAWRIATYGSLIALAIVAWLVSDLRMSGMDNGPGTDLGTIGFYLTTWVVMMAAMMFPSVAPMIATYVGIQRGRRRKVMPAPAGASACFAAGYLLTWTGAGVIAYLLVRSGNAAAGDALSWDRGGRWFAASVLAAAAIYELTPLKLACLSRCRGPLTFILTSWRDGRFGAVWMGALHGAWCVGCCWALMAALFALGVMSLAWMALIGALIAIEKLLPWRRAATFAVAGLLVALALGVAVAPDRMPGLTIPAPNMSMN